jgi:hypothetical protein
LNANADPLAIKAEPTKELFIFILTRDIQTIDAIIDLVDNCVDGARRIRPSNDYHGLTIRIEVSRTHFKISDNCGGIAVNTARNYAFRFGRPREMPSTLRSIGQFGVGMKRALFRLGRQFTIQSVTLNSRFVVNVDVPKWQIEPGWEFKFSQIDENTTFSEDQIGTSIKVTELDETIAETFEIENFRIQLKNRLQEKHQDNLDHGLTITLNQEPLKSEPALLLFSDHIKPGYREKVFRDLTAPVTAKIYSGVGMSSPRDAGWYVFCNGRLVVGADKSNVTGWGQDDEVTIPRYHNQFARFRGYVYFDSDDASLLPWNTTKTTVDPDSPIYSAIKLEMLSLMRPVIDFLNALDKEKDQQGTGQDLDAFVKEAELTSKVKVSSLTIAPAKFTAPPTQITPTKSTMATITYKKDIKDVEKVKAVLRAGSNREIGEKTFDYFLRLECGE